MTRVTLIIININSIHLVLARDRWVEHSMDFVGALFGRSPGARSNAPSFLEGVVSDVLQSVLGNFIRGLDRSHLELSMWDGDMRLHDLELRTELLDALPLPVRVLCGSLGEVRISVPWRDLLGNQPMLISIDRVLLPLAPRSGDAEPTEDAPAEAHDKSNQARVEAVEAVEEIHKAREQMSFADRIVHALTQRLQISITNVHVRVQGGPEADALAGGVMLRSVRLDDLSDEAARPETEKATKAELKMLRMLSRKRVAISGLSMYIDTAANSKSSFGALPPHADGTGAGTGAGAGAATSLPPRTLSTAAASAASAAAPSAFFSAAASSAAADSVTRPRGAFVGMPADWEARMLTMISAAAGPTHVIGPVDITAGATFDLSGHVRPGNRRLGRTDASPLPRTATSRLTIARQPSAPSASRRPSPASRWMCLASWSILTCHTSLA